MGVVTTENLFFAVVANTAWVLAAIYLHIKAGAFLCLHNLRKLAHNASKCTDIVRL